METRRCCVSHQGPKGLHSETASSQQGGRSGEHEECQHSEKHDQAEEQAAQGRILELELTDAGVPDNKVSF